MVMKLCKYISGKIISVGTPVCSFIEKLANIQQLNNKVNKNNHKPGRMIWGA